MAGDFGYPCPCLVESVTQIGILAYLFTKFTDSVSLIGGTVARYFLPSVFFMDLFYMGLRFRGKKDFRLFFVFAKLIEYFDESVL